MRRWTTTTMAAVVAAAAFVAGAPGVSAAPGCANGWGSRTADVATMSSAPVTDVRAGRHSCYDRLVVDLDGAAAGYHVGYVEEVTADGSGHAVPLRGGAALQVVVRAPAHGDTELTYLPPARSELVDTAGMRTFRQVAFASTFEGQTTLGLGVRARLPFRVFVMDGPGAGSRVVVDVAHRW